MNSVSFQFYCPVDGEILPNLQCLFEITLGPMNLQKLKQRCVRASHSHLGVALDGDRIVGFKLGYALNNNVFYSYVGGVHPEYRRQGIAKNLLREQIKFCRENNYSKLRTKSKDKFSNMVAFNLKNGFTIIDNKLSDSEKIVFELDL